VANTLHLKRPAGWFAAGREVESALRILSDAAFKVFFWLCLQADRRSGSARVDYNELASVLGRTEDEIRVALRELVECGVCNPPLAGVVVIADECWPYERAAGAVRNEGPELAQYILEVKRLFLNRRCVQSTFAAADVKLATELYRRGVSVDEVGHAILLGSFRKYAALVNNGGGTPVTTLYYFSALLDEVRQEISDEYCKHVARKVDSLESRWQSYADIVRGGESVKYRR
jgi:hypothetical protein